MQSCGSKGFVRNNSQRGSSLIIPRGPGSHNHAVCASRPSSLIVQECPQTNVDMHTRLRPEPTRGCELGHAELLWTRFSRKHRPGSCPTPGFGDLLADTGSLARSRESADVHLH